MLVLAGSCKAHRRSNPK
ncbi:hypothetical protein D039_2942A, partial [Vibrio parahaemolyticus EKP-028]